MLKKGALALLGVLLLLVAVVLARALLATSKAVPAEPVAVDVDEGPVSEHLAAAVRLRTVANRDRTKIDPEPFLALHQQLADTYPKTHATLTREVVDELSLLYTWPGSDPALPPVVLMCHMDVVPIAPGTEGDWEQPPFDGVIDDQFVWGRGTLDDKMECVVILEAVEALVARGFSPKRTLHLSYGHDEEVTSHGVQAIVKLLKDRGVKPEFVVDEGMMVIEPAAVGATRPVAFVAVTEKGYATFRLTARGDGGHSSVPPPETVVGRIGRAVSLLEQHQMPARLEGITAESFAYLAPEMPFGQRVAMANLWLFGGVVQGILSGTRAGNATLRTTTAPTVLRAGEIDNVLAQEAVATINFRIKPGDTLEGVEQHIRDVVQDDGIELEVQDGAREASPVSPTDNRAFRLLSRTISEVIPEATVAPQVMIAGSDARFFHEITDAVYRFMPFYLTLDDTDRIHGTNERVEKKQLARAVVFYRRLLEQALSE